MIKKIKFKPLDLITFGYLIFVIIYILAGWKNVHQPVKHLSIHIGIGLLIFVFIKLSDRYDVPIFHFFRNAYTLFFIGYFFESTSAFNRVIFTDFIDPYFQKIDQILFGYQPSIVWGKLDSFFVQEIFHFSYFSYYIMMPGLAILLYVRKREKFYSFLFSFSFVFYLCYITYSILPVVGGRFFQEAYDYTIQLRYGIFTKVMALIYQTTTHMGGAFPSSHVAIALVVTLAALQFERKVGLIFLPVTILLIFSTVFCHYHYFIDIIGGIFYGVFFYFLSLSVHEKIKKRMVKEKIE